MNRRALEEFRERARGVSHRDALNVVTAEVLEAFLQVGVRSLLLKGPALAWSLYDANEVRGYRDIDLLVAPDDVPHAQRALAGLGFANKSEIRGIVDVAGIVHAEIWTRRGEDKGLVIIDLHWRLAGCEAPPRVVWEALAARRTSIEISARRAPILDREGLAFQLALHAAG
jgi:hypothetical protein